MKDNRIYTKQLLEDKIEGLTLARQTTINVNDAFKLDRMIEQYKNKYQEFVGEPYNESR